MPLALRPSRRFKRQRSCCAGWLATWSAPLYYEVVEGLAASPSFLPVPRVDPGARWPTPRSVSAHARWGLLAFQYRTGSD
eukprot:scaffold4768_cov412-Prasinococcus_capsulatus_cf.AAC.10